MARSVLFEGEPPTDFNQAKPTGPVYLDVISQFLREDFYSPFRAKKRVYTSFREMEVAR